MTTTCQSIYSVIPFKGEIKRRLIQGYGQKIHSTPKKLYESIVFAMSNEGKQVTVEMVEHIDKTWHIKESEGYWKIVEK